MIETRHGMARLVQVKESEDGQMEIVLELIE